MCSRVLSKNLFQTTREVLLVLNLDVFPIVVGARPAKQKLEVSKTIVGHFRAELFHLVLQVVKPSHCFAAADQQFGVEGHHALVFRVKVLAEVADYYNLIRRL